MYIHSYEIILIMLFLSLSAFFSGSETALFSLRKADLHRYSNSPSMRERAISRMMDKPYNILITLLTGNLFVNIGLSALSTSILLGLWPAYGQFIAIGVVTPVVIILCEITPKAMAINSARTMARRVTPVLDLIHRLLFPVRFVMLYYSEYLIRLFHLKMNAREITEEELTHAVSVGLEEGVISGEEGDFLKNVLRFSKKEAGNIMFPRNRAVFIPWGMSTGDAIRVFLESDVIRAPVFKGDLDHVVGMVDSRELIPCHLGYRKARNINGFVQKIDFFPATRGLDDLLKDFIAGKIQIAVVVDEYGGTAGVVTLNAILAELMGKGFTRWEVDTKSDIRRIHGNVTLISGEMQIADFNYRFHERISSHESDTMGGYVAEKLTHLPRRGEELRTERHLLRVKHVRRNRIESIEVISGESQHPQRAARGDDDGGRDGA